MSKANVVAARYARSRVTMIYAPLDVWEDGREV